MKGFKTVIIMGSSFALMIMDFISPEILTDALGLGSQGRAIAVMALPIIGLALRAVTTSPMGKKL